MKNSRIFDFEDVGLKDGSEGEAVTEQSQHYCRTLKWVSINDLNNTLCIVNLQISSNLFPDDLASYRNYFRMSKETFLELANGLRPMIQRSDTHLRRAIRAEEKLGYTLRFLATGRLETSI